MTRKIIDMKKLALTSLLLFIMGFSFGQQDPIMTQYLFDKLPMNPGNAGSVDALSVNLIDRYQWVGIKDGPNTITLTANSYLPNPHLGVGLFVYRDALGPSVETGVMGSFAYKILFPKGKLSFGVQFGFNYLNIDWSALNPNDPGDPVINNQVKRKAVPDAGVGIYYYSRRFYAGISSTHLLQNEMVVSKDNQNNSTSFSKLLRHFYGISGVAIPLSETIDLRPSILVKYVQNAPVQADVNVSMLFNGIFWVGVGYRTEKCMTFLVDVNIAKNLHIGYSYDAWFNELKSYNMGSHEIRLGYDFDIFGLEKMVTPRYF
jgi:type IX secretion system PorP/SprF family membrane protein